MIKGKGGNIFIGKGKNRFRESHRAPRSERSLNKGVSPNYKKRGDKVMKLPG